MAENPNDRLLVSAVQKLNPLLDRIVFVGGCATGLLVTDPGAAPVRVTFDIDVIVEVATNRSDAWAPATGTANPTTAAASYAELLKLEEILRSLGFRESREEGAPRCRWVSGELILDLMPTDPSILGFSNRWYRPALQNSQKARIGDHEIRLITAPYFLATKLEAFHGRGNSDYRMSRDLEDIITVIDGRPELAKEVSTALPELCLYLSQEFRSILSTPDFHEALPWHLMPDDVSQQRAAVIVERIRSMIEV
jgi:hypothetical protein